MRDGEDLDRSALDGLLGQVEELEEDEYTPESWEDLEDALALPETTQDEIDDKVSAINAAIAGLEEVEEPVIDAEYAHEVAGKKFTFTMPAGTTTLTDVTVNGVVTFDYLKTGDVVQIRVQDKLDIVTVTIDGIVYSVVAL